MDHRGVAVGQKMAKDEGYVTGGHSHGGPDRVFDVSSHARDHTFQSLKLLQPKD